MFHLDDKMYLDINEIKLVNNRILNKFFYKRRRAGIFRFHKKIKAIYLFGNNINANRNSLPSINIELKLYIKFIIFNNELF